MPTLGSVEEIKSVSSESHASRGGMPHQRKTSMLPEQVGGMDSEHGKTREGHLKYLLKLSWFEDKMRKYKSIL